MTYRHVGFFIIFLALQLGFWWHTHIMLPKMDIVAEVPGEKAVKAISFGDEQFYFRALALQMQNFGDTFGRFTALKQYDFGKLYRWWKLFDALDARSHFVPTIAAYYFSQTQHTPDVRYVVNYLYEHSAPQIEQKWWWLVQAVYLANHKLKDPALALKVAQPLTTNTKIPVWAQQMPAFLHEQRGEMGEALAIMENINKNVKDIPPSELKFMQYFVDERLHALDSTLSKELHQKTRAAQ